MKTLLPTFLFGLISHFAIAQDCIDPDQIDPEMGCIEIYSPVCGCDNVTYANECYAFYQGGVTSWTEGECLGIPPGVCLGVLPPGLDFGECEFVIGVALVNGSCETISGCSTIASNGIDYAEYFYSFGGEFQCESCLEILECVNEDQIDPEMGCFEVYEPVCGCDGVTYSNECYAYYYGGVSSWLAGECQVEPCTDLAGIDFGLCDFPLGIAIINGTCQSISGCDYLINGINYEPAFYTSEAECEACLEPEDCINPDQIDEEMLCIEIFDPVCGCDSVTYQNDCYAFYFGGVTSWTEGECLNLSEPCDDLSMVDFGLCDMFLGVAVINDECQNVSGCGYIVDGIDYSPSFYDSFEECNECITTGLVDIKNDFRFVSLEGFNLMVENTIAAESLIIFSLTGKEIARFGPLQPGNHVLQVPESTPGIYLFRVQTAGSFETGKLLMR